MLRKPSPRTDMTDWEAIVSDLIEALGKADLAKAADAGVQTMVDLAKGTTREPRYGLGQRLLALHRRHCKKAA